MAHRIRPLIAVVCLLAWLVTSIGWARSHFAQDLFVYQYPRPPAGHWWSALRVQSGMIAVEYESKAANDTARTYDSTICTADGTVQRWRHLSFPLDPANPGYTSTDERWHGIPIGFKHQPLTLAGDFFGSIPPDGVDPHSIEGSAWCPYWMPWLSLTAIAGLTCRRAWRRRRRLGRCSNCGYDLHASPGRCPECGTTPV